MNEPEYTRYNVVIELPSEVKSEVITLSKNLAESAAPLFILDGINFFPHITLYSPAYPTKNTEKVREEVKKIAQQKPPFECILQDIQLGQGYWNNKSFIAKEIGIYEMGENGTCVKLLDKISLLTQS